MATTQLMTADELEEMAPDEFRYELIRGELRRMAPAGFAHGKFANRVNVPLTVFVEEHDLGEVVIAEPGFVLEFGPDTVLAPDVAFVRKDRLPPEAEQARFARLAPDLAIEVSSPSDRPRDIAEKVAIYLGAGVRLLWLFYPASQTVQVHRPEQEPVELGINDVLDGEDVVPGFRLPLADVFRPPWQR